VQTVLSVGVVNDVIVAEVAVEAVRVVTLVLFTETAQQQISKHKTREYKVSWLSSSLACLNEKFTEISI